MGHKTDYAFYVPLFHCENMNLKDRINCFQFVLYVDSDTLNFEKVIDVIKSVEFYSCKYYYCLHDKDINENGEFKKAHYHLIVKLDNAIAIDKIINCLSNDDNIKIALQNNISIVKSFKGACRYLIHYDNKEKYQYNLNDIVSNDKNLSYYFNDNSIIDNFALITSLIKNNNITNMRELIYYCVENNELLAMQYIQDNAYLVNCLFRY